MDASAPRTFSLEYSLGTFPSPPWLFPSPPTSASSSAVAGARRNSASTSVATLISSGDGRRQLNRLGMRSSLSPSLTLEATQRAGITVGSSAIGSSAANRSSMYVPVRAPHSIEDRCAAISASRSDLPVTLSSNMDRRTADTSEEISTILGPPLCNALPSNPVSHLSFASFVGETIWCASTMPSATNLATSSISAANARSSGTVRLGTASSGACVAAAITICPTSPVRPLWVLVSANCAS
mmetsp:Transcript_11901/g.47816  ORF Transcript_11901/g.47816 Transcript_11901/m.47816 type:complete len:240 (+) Transcript_11901:964-1683(+)